MRKSLKITTVAAVVVIALGTLAYVYACSQNGATANANEQQLGIQAFFRANNITLPDNVTLPNNVTFPSGRMRPMPQMQIKGLQLPYGFLQNASLSTISGTIVSTVKGMLVLDTNSGQIQVLLPNAWTVGNTVVGRAALFNGTFASPGQNVTIKVLESNVFSNANFSINEMLGYEAINATGTEAYAVLPFNIQPAS